MIDWLSQATIEHSNKIALIHEDEIITFSQLNDQINLLCSYFNSIGLNEKEMIAVYVESSLEYIYLIHTFMRYNLIFVPINTQLTISEVKWQLSSLNIEHFITSKKLGSELDLSMLSVITYFIDDIFDYHSSINLDFNLKSHRRIELEDILCIIFTSGTTGKPKAAAITYNNVYSSAISSQTRLSSNSEEKWLLTIPLFHIGGLSIIYRSIIYHTSVVIINKFDELNLPEIVKKYEITMVSLIPVMLKRILSHFNYNPFHHSLRLILLGGANTDRGLIRITQKLKIPIAVTYGLTEASSQIATAIHEQVFNKPLSVGKPLDGVEIKITNSDGLEVHRNEIGNILIKGPNLIKSYVIGNPENFLKDGYFKTGDIGYIDDLGDLFVLSRRSDLIITGGENVYPSEVENVIYTYPEINQVCIVSVPSERWGEVVTAILAVTPDYKQTEFKQICERNLGSYKIPKHIIIVDKLPQTASGKIDRKACKTIALMKI